MLRLEMFKLLALGTIYIRDIIRSLITMKIFNLYRYFRH